MSLQDLIGQLRWHQQLRSKQAVELLTSVPHNTPLEKQSNYDRASHLQDDAQVLAQAIRILETSEAKQEEAPHA